MTEFLFVFHALRANSFSDLSLAAIIVVALPGLWQAGGFSLPLPTGRERLGCRRCCGLSYRSQTTTKRVKVRKPCPDNLDRNPCRVMEAQPHCRNNRTSVEADA